MEEPCERNVACDKPPEPFLPEDTVTYGGIALGSVLLIGIILLVIAKILVWLRNRKMYNLWLEEEAKAMATAEQNPLFQADEVAFENPLFDPDADGAGAGSFF